MHFMNPPPVMKLVEIIRGASTSDDTFNATKSLAERWVRKNWTLILLHLANFTLVLYCFIAQNNT